MHKLIASKLFRQVLTNFQFYLNTAMLSRATQHVQFLQITSKCVSNRVFVVDLSHCHNTA